MSVLTRGPGGGNSIGGSPPDNSSRWSSGAPGDKNRRPIPPQQVETPSQFPLCENGCPSNMENAEKDVITSRDERPLVRFSRRLARI